jgi:hypothetical protein
MKRERTAEEKVKALLDFLDEEEDKPGKDLPDLEGMSDADVEKAMAEAGIDVEAENRKAEAEHQAAVAALAAHREAALAAHREAALAAHREAALAAERKAEPPMPASGGKVVVLPQRRVTRWAIPLAAAAAIALLFAFEGEALIAYLEQPSINEKTGSALDPKLARRMARAALERGDWQHCLSELDFAKQLDPAGDSASDVVEMRRRAEAMGSVDGGDSG